MKNITNKDLKRMIDLMGNKKPINENKTISSVELIKKSSDGKFYGIVRETKKYFIKESTDGSNFNFIGGVANKTKNQFESYEQAVRRLNLMLEDTDVLTPDFITEKKFVIKTKAKKSKPTDTEETTGGFDFGGGGEEKKSTDTEETDTFNFGGSGEKTDDTEETGGDFGGGDEEEEDASGDFDFGGGDEEEEDASGDFDSEDQDYDLESEEDPIKSIQRMTGKLGQKIRDTLDISSDMSKWVAKSVLSALNLEDMDSDDKKDLIRTIKKKKEEGTEEESDFMSTPIMSYMADDMVDWNQLTDKEKALLVNPNSNNTDVSCTHCNGLGHNDMTGQECEWCMGTGVENVEDYMVDYMEDDVYGPGSTTQQEDSNVILDNDNEEDHCSYCGDRDMPYNEDEPYDVYPGINEPDWRSPRMDYMSRYAKNVKRGKAVKGQKIERHELDDYLKKVKNKLGGNVSIDGNKVVGDFGYVEVTSNGYVLHKEGSKYEKHFDFDQLGKLKKEAGGEEDYMGDPYMMPKTAPAKPETAPETPVAPPKTTPDRPDPRTNPFVPPVPPGIEEDPNPKAEEKNKLMPVGNRRMPVGNCRMPIDYMEEPEYYGSFDQKSWYGPKDMGKQLDRPSYEYEENEYPNYESFRKSKYGQDPSNKWFAQGSTGERMFNTYRDKFGPMKIRSKRDVNYDETSEMFGTDYMDETDFDLGPKIKGRPANNPIAIRGNVSKTYLTDLQKRNREAKRQADTDISKHFSKYGDFNSHETPSDDWRKYPLPYDTHFGDDVDYMEDNENMEICSACEGRGHEHGRIGFGRQTNPCITCAGTGMVPRMEVDGEVDEPYVDSSNPMGYEEGTSTLPRGMGHRYQYKEKFNFPFTMGENSRRNKRTLREDHLNNKMASYEQDMAYEDVESMARERGMDVELCHKDKSRDPEEQTVYLDLMKKGKAVAKIRINTAGNIEMGHMTGKVFKGEPVDSLSDFDEVLAEKGIKMMPKTAPAKPETAPETPVAPPQTTPDKPNPRTNPFVPPAPPGIEEDPNPKAKKKRSYSYMDEPEQREKLENVPDKKGPQSRPPQRPFNPPQSDDKY